MLKSYLILFLFSFLNLAAFGQSRSEGNHDSQGRRTGVWKEYYGSRLDNETTYKEGKREGAFKTYWRSGSVFQIGQYKADKSTGEWTLYHENNKIKEKGHYLNGKKTGSWRYYNKRGTLRSVTNYLEGKKSGLYQSFWKDGVPDEKGNYLKDKKIGDWIKYDYNRKTDESFLRYKGTYASGGKKIGRWEEYRYLSGQLKKLETFNDQGVLNGPYEEYDFSDRLVAKGEMLMGKRNGTWELRENDGEYKVTVTYIDDIKNGPYEKKTQQNSLIEKGNYKNDLKEGYWEEVDNAGIKGKGKYILDKRIGQWEFFHPSIKSHPVMLIEYNNDGMELTRKQFDDQNTLLLDLSYNTADASKSYKAYYPDGSLKTEGKYVNDKQEGVWRDYYPNGSLGLAKSFSNGVMEGELKQLYPDGKVKVRLSFSNGLLWNLLEMNDINGQPLDGGTLKNGNGTFISYDDNGKLQQVQNIVNGQVQK